MTSGITWIACTGRPGRCAGIARRRRTSCRTPTPHVLARPRWLRGSDDLGYLLRALRNTQVSRARAARPPAADDRAGRARRAAHALGSGRLRRGGRAVRRDRRAAARLPRGARRDRPDRADATARRRGRCACARRRSPRACTARGCASRPRWATGDGALMSGRDDRAAERARDGADPRGRRVGARAAAACAPRWRRSGSPRGGRRAGRSRPLVFAGAAAAAALVLAVAVVLVVRPGRHARAARSPTRRRSRCARRPTGRPRARRDGTRAPVRRRRHVPGLRALEGLARRRHADRHGRRARRRHRRLRAAARSGSATRSSTAAR